MKLSAFLAVTVPIVAMSAHCPALASNESDAASWLKESIQTLQPARAKHKKVSHATPLAAQPATVKLRPFVPNRFLPSERDLQRSLVAQQAKFDYSAGEPNAASGYATNRQLSGQVNAYGAAARIPSAYDKYSMPSYASTESNSLAPMVARIKQAAKKAIATRAPRVVPNQTPVLPEQLQPTAVQPVIPEPPSQRAAKPHFPMSMPVAVMQPPPQAETNLQPPAKFQLPPITPQQQAELARLVADNPPTARMEFNGDVVGTASDNPSNGIGQPPFPLNLLPMNAMQTLAATHHRTNAPQARFGSWHSSAGLAEAGFHTYLPRRKPVMFEYTRAPLPQTRRKSPSSGSRKSNVSAVTSNVAQLQPKVASYPPFTSARGFAY